MAPRKAATKAAAKNKALTMREENDAIGESKNENKITDHFKVKFDITNSSAAMWFKHLHRTWNKSKTFPLRTLTWC